MTNPKPNLIILLVVAPFLGAIIQAIISNLLGVDYSSLILLFLLFNFALAYYDMDRLKLTGEYNDTLKYFAIIPLYLYRRAKLLNHSYSYAIIWSLLFIIVILTPPDTIKEFAWIITF